MEDPVAFLLHEMTSRMHTYQPIGGYQSDIMPISTHYTQSSVK